MKLSALYITVILLMTQHQVYAQPDAIITDPESAVASSSATVEGRIDLGIFQNSSDYFFRYSKNFDLSSSTDSPINTASGPLGSVLNLSQTLTGLDPGTLYHYQLRIPPSGAGSGGSIESFFTLSDVSSSPVADFTLNNSSPSSIDLDWTKPSSLTEGYVILFAPGASAPIPSTELQQGVNPLGQSFTNLININDVNTETISVSGLSAETQYSFVIVPYNSNGTNDSTYHYNTSSFSQTSAYTLAVEPSADPGSVTIEAISANSVSLSFTKAADVKAYFITYKKDGTNTPENINADDLDGTDGADQLSRANTDGSYIIFSEEPVINTELIGLDPETQYNFRIFSMSASSEGVIETYNYKRNASTIESGSLYTYSIEPASTPGSFLVSNVLPNQLSFNFDSYPSLDISGFVLFYSETSSPPLLNEIKDGIAPGNQVIPSGSGVFNSSPSITSISSQDNLSPGTQYTFYLIPYHYDDANDETYNYNTAIPANATLWTRSATPPNEVTDLSLSNPTASTIDLNFTPVGGADGYISIYAPTVDGFDTTQISDGVAPNAQTLSSGFIKDLEGGTSPNLESLAANTDYTVMVIPYNVVVQAGPTTIVETYNYKLEGGIAESIMTVCDAPPIQAAFSSGQQTATTALLNWSDLAGADSYLILAQEDVDAFFSPNNGDSFTGNTDYSSATIVGADNKVIYAGAYPPQPFEITGLESGNTYQFAIIAYNDLNNCYNQNPPDIIDITTDLPSNNNTLSIISTANTISSTANDESNAFVDAFIFSLNDEGVDKASTHLTGLTITAGDSDYFKAMGLNWFDIIAEAQLVNTSTLNNETIPLSITTTGQSLVLAVDIAENDVADEFGFIADASSVNMTLQLKLKNSISATDIDNKNFSFSINPGSITVESPSSGFDPAGTIIVSDPNRNEIVVEASQFVFTTQPPSIINAGENMTPQPVIEARDGNGNIDLDFSTAFTVSNSGAIPMENAPSTGFASGELIFPADFRYLGNGDGTLTLLSGALSGTSDVVVVNPSIIYSNTVNGLASATLNAGATDQALLGVDISALGSANLNQISITTDQSISDKFLNFRLYRSTNSTFEGVASEALVSATVNVDDLTREISFTSFSEPIGASSRFYFIVADVAINVNEFNTLPINLSAIQTAFIYDETINNGVISLSKTYSFKDLISPEVFSVSPSIAVISDSDNTNNFIISITYNEEMDPSANPAITFPVEDPTSSISLQSGSWSASNTVYDAVYLVSDQNILLNDINVDVSGAKDISQNPQVASSNNDVFSIDTENPTVGLVLSSNVINLDNLSTTLTATFSEEMNPAINPAISINGSTNITQDGPGIWSSSNSVYTITYTHDATQEDVAINSFSINNAQDVHGNIMTSNTSPNYTIDTEPAKIINISSNTLNGIYGPSEIIEIIVSFDDNITVSVAPAPILSLDAGPAEASFISVSNNEITFQYTVGAIGSGENTIDLNATGIILGTSTIQDPSGNNAIIDMPVAGNNLAANAEIAIDTEPAQVLTVSSTTADGFYNEGDQINIQILFNEKVNVAGGLPELDLLLEGGVIAKAFYTNMLDPQTLNFQYIVGPGENINTLEYNGQTALILPVGVSISDTVDIPSDITLPPVGGGNSLGDSHQITIDTRDPILSTTPFLPENNSLNVSHLYNFSIEFDEPVSGFGNNNIRLRRFSDDVLIKSFDADTLFTNGNSLRLELKSLEAYIDESTKYYFELDAGSVIDRAGNPYGGITGNFFWTFTSAGPARVDNNPEGACVGENFSFTGEYFTGVSSIVFGSGASTTVYNGTEFTVSADGLNIDLIVKEFTIGGNIEFIKENGSLNNTETFNSFSPIQVIIGPSSAQLSVTPSDICNFDGTSNSLNQAELSVSITGGSGIFDIVYNNGVEDISLTNYVNGDIISVIPPSDNTNTYELISVKDNNPLLSLCTVPTSSLGTTVSIEKYIRSVVQAGGFEQNVGDEGEISFCVAGAANSYVDLSDIGQMNSLPTITGDVTTGTWSIVGFSASSGGFGASQNSTSTDLRPRYYFSLDEVAKGQVVLKLESDTPIGSNPCSASSDQLIIRFLSSAQARPSSPTISTCRSLVAGQPQSISQLNAVLEGGAIGVIWTTENTTDAAAYDGTWGFADTESASSFTLSSTTIDPFYKAGPSELSANRAVVNVEASSGTCGSATADPIPLEININRLLTPSFSLGAGLNPIEVCSGEERVSFRANPTRSGTTFKWAVIDPFDANNKSIIRTASVAGEYGNLIEIDFAVVSQDTTAVIEFVELENGCISDTLRREVRILASPTAIIITGPSSTIDNNSTESPLSGGGVYANNDTIRTGQFFGPGVVLKSDGSYVLNTTTLDPTSVTNSADDYTITFVHTTDLGCEVVATRNFDVFDRESSFPGLEAVYCADIEAFEITLDNNVLSAGIEVVNIYGPGASTGVEFIDPGTTNLYKALIDPQKLLNDNNGDSNISIFYSTRNINTGEVTINGGSQPVTINPLPIPAPIDLNDSYCSSEEIIILRRDEILNPNNSFEFTMINSGLPVDLLKVESNPKAYFLDLSVLTEYFINNGQDSVVLNLLYQYTSDANCINTKELETIIYNLPVQPMIISDTNLFTYTVANGVITNRDVVMVDSTAGLETYWFADNSNFERGEQLAVGNSFTPNIDLNSASEDYYAVRFDNGCVSEFTRVIYYRQEPPSFNWNSSVFSEASPIIFTADNRNTANQQVNIDSAMWTIISPFNSETIMNIVDDGGLTFSNSFVESGEYQVMYTIFTDKGSEVSTSRTVVVVPEAKSFYQSFNGGLNNWASTGENSSWERVSLSENNSFINDDSLWVTNNNGNYNSNERSYLYSPSFNISEIDQPVVSFKLWLNTFINDGLVLEYSVDNELIGSENKEWIPVGEGLGSGLDWYNTNELPIRDIGFAIGWSERLNNDTINYSNARHDLLIVQNAAIDAAQNVIFRFNFSSSGSTTRNGVAIDDFSIESLNRTRLIEYFGNSSVQDIQQLQSVNSTYLSNNNLAFINYRLNENDSAYASGASETITRRNFYEAFEANNDFVLDGEYFESALITGSQAEISQRVLVSSSYELDIKVDNSGLGLDVSVNVESIGNRGFDDNTRLMLAIVKADHIFQGNLIPNVIVAYAPSAQGIEIDANGQYDFSYTPEDEFSATGLRVIAFLQKFDGNKEVFQAAVSSESYDLNFNLLSAVSKTLGILKLYPNPANDFCILEAEENLIDYNIILTDLSGRVVFKRNIDVSTTSYQIDTSDLSTGLYQIRIFKPGEGLGESLRLSVRN